MIQWTISVEPVWSITASTHVYSSGGLFKQDYNEFALGVPALSAALGVRRDSSVFRTENWSQTIENEYDVNHTKLETIIRGTTNSVDSTSTFNNTLQTGSSSILRTILGTSASETSTTKTIQKAFTTTTNSTQHYSVFSTTALTSESATYRTTTRITSQTRSYKKTTTQTEELTVDTTTTTGAHLGNVYAATVYQANTRHASNAEVIWVANQSAADAVAGGAASDYATSTTRTTIWPVMQTTEFSISDNTTTSAFSFTNSISSQNVAFVKPKVVSTVETAVMYVFAIPQITATQDGISYDTENTDINYTVFTSNTFTAAKTKQATQTGLSIAKINDTQGGLACDRTYYKTATRSIKSNDTLWTTSGTTTSTASAPKAIWKTSSAASDTQEIQGSPISQSTNQAEGRTTLLMPGWQATTAIGGFASMAIEAVSGVRTPDNEISGYYGAEGITCFAGAFASASRDVWTAMPSSFSIYTNLGNLEELDLSKIGSATLSSLSGTATTTKSEGTETTSSSFTFSLTPQGNGTTFRESLTVNVGSLRGVLGVSETAIVTIAGGVYKDISGGTVFKTEEVKSYTSGSDLNYLERVTCFQPGATTAASAILWTSLRNSTALP